MATQSLRILLLLSFFMIGWADVPPELPFRQYARSDELSIPEPNDVSEPATPADATPPGNTDDTPPSNPDDAQPPGNPG
jgi:hypothetical protein